MLRSPGTAKIMVTDKKIKHTSTGAASYANRLGQFARPARRRGDSEHEVVELNSRVPVRDEPNKKEESLEGIAARYSIIRPKQSREFHQTETRLTTPGSGYTARSG
jgi:hypothetical protein